MLYTCPLCGNRLIKDNKRAVCASGHSFDFAKSGYLNLLISNSSVHGDAPDMIRARTRFLQTGSYGFLRDRLAQITDELSPEVLLDLGCGEGYYTSALHGEEKYGFDLSKDALIHASKHDRSTQYAVASIFSLPLPDASADAVLTCFAPYAQAEIGRILKSGGRFIFVTPGRKHLFEMKEILYEKPYENRTDPLETDLAMIHEECISDTFTVGNEALQDLFAMTPYARHTPPEGREKLSQVREMQVTASFIIRIYQKTDS
ncbi:MAG: methyltransferase domain-containing protein [Solobacterium sp.]|nr:methyltransferase domain-containing protein [Solobacterium sp.]